MPSSSGHSSMESESLRCEAGLLCCDAVRARVRARSSASAAALLFSRYRARAASGARSRESAGAEDEQLGLGRLPRVRTIAEVSEQLELRAEQRADVSAQLSRTASGRQGDKRQARATPRTDGYDRPSRGGLIGCPVLVSCRVVSSGWAVEQSWDFIKSQAESVVGVNLPRGNVQE